MLQNAYLAPRSERWVFLTLARMVSERLQSAQLEPADRRGLTRLLFGLQRFPRITPGLNVQLSWGEGGLPDMYLSISMSEEFVQIERCQTWLYYDSSVHHCISSSHRLYGDERESLLESWIPLFDGLEDVAEPVCVADYSTGTSVDEPPLSESWQEPLEPIFFDTVGNGEGRGS